jgi:hypothetical protein
MRLSFTACTPGVTSMQGNNNIEPGRHPSVWRSAPSAGFEGFSSSPSAKDPSPTLQAQLCVSALSARYNSISDEIAGASVAGHRPPVIV